MEYCDIAPRRPGRPRVISEEFVPLVIRAYKAGAGYRAISHYLEDEGITASWSTVRRVVKKQLRRTREPRIQYCQNRIHRYHLVSCKLGKVGFHICTNLVL
jgi:hypothetical protein